MSRMRYEFQEEDAKRFAQEQGIKVKRVGKEMIFAHCPYCGATTNKRDKFSIDTKTGMFHCFRASCGVKGNMITLAKDFDFSLGDRELDEYYRPTRTFRRFKKTEPIEPTDPAISYMDSRDILKDVVQKYQITTNDKGMIVFPFMDENGEIQFIKYRNPAPKDGENKEWSERNCKPILFGMYQCNLQNDTLVVTEGQIDSLSVAQAGIENAVSVPTGANGFTWVPYCWNWVSKFNKIIIFGDHEHDHITLYNDFVSRWGADKVWHVREEDYMGCKDANEILQEYGPEQIKICIKNAVTAPVPRVKKLSSVAYVNPNEFEKLSTGINVINSTLKGGMPFGQVILITGKAGDGKSTFASQLLLNAIEEGYKCFAYSGELPDYLFKSWLDAQAAGYWNTEMEKPRWSDVEIPKVRYAAVQQISEWYKDNVYIYDNTDVNDDSEEDELISLLERSINHYGVRVFLIDNLMTALDLEATIGTDKYDCQSRFMKKLAKLAVNYNVLILIVAHKRKDTRFTETNDNVSGSADVVNLASIVMSYERNKDIDDSQRLLKITKNRLYGTLNTNGIVLEYDSVSKRIYKTEKELERRYEWEMGFTEDAELEVAPFGNSFLHEEVPF